MLTPGHSDLDSLKTPGQRPHVQDHYLAGGNDKRRIRAKTIQNKALHSYNWDLTKLLCTTSSDTRRYLKHLLSVRDDGSAWDPMALKAKGQDPDLNPTWEQAMNGPLAEGHMKAAEKEYQTLVDMGVWEVVKRQWWMNVLPSTWAFTKKLYPSGLVRKLKSHFCARGD